MNVIFSKTNSNCPSNFVRDVNNKLQKRFLNAFISPMFWALCPHKKQALKDIRQNRKIPSFIKKNPFKLRCQRMYFIQCLTRITFLVSQKHQWILKNELSIDPLTRTHFIHVIKCSVSLSQFSIWSYNILLFEREAKCVCVCVCV